MQQRVYDFRDAVFAETDTCGKTEEFLKEATKKTISVSKSTGAGEYARVFCSFSESLQNVNSACHAAFSGAKCKPLVLNVHKFGNFKTKSHFSESFIKDFYDWLYSPLGPWGPAMERTVLLLEKGSDIPLSCLWLNPGETPVHHLVHNCISSRILTEHAAFYDNVGLENLYETFGHMGFAFAACHFFKDEEVRKYGVYPMHSGYKATHLNFPLSYITGESESTKDLWKDIAASVYVNILWEYPTIKINSKTPVEFYEEAKPHMKEYK